MRKNKLKKLMVGVLVLTLIATMVSPVMAATKYKEWETTWSDYLKTKITENIFLGEKGWDATVSISRTQVDKMGVDAYYYYKVYGITNYKPIHFQQSVDGPTSYTFSDDVINTGAHDSDYLEIRIYVTRGGVERASAGDSFYLLEY